MGEALYIHPLVQSAMMMRISKAESAKYFDLVTSLLSSSFLNTWNIVTNHQFATWMDCDQCIHHVGHLIRLLPELPKDSIDINAFAELILRCTWYIHQRTSFLFLFIPSRAVANREYRNLHEREDYTAAITFLDAALGIIARKSSLIYASALMLRGFIELDINKPRASFASFFQALNIRQRIMQPRDEFIASSLNALSLACTEFNELSKAQEYGLRAIEIRLRNRSDRIGNSYSNMASTLLRMGKPDEAEAMLKQCPSIKSFSDQSFLDSKDPRFSG
jgi:tetratricopeptide (TPR) repeat protein